MGAGAVPSVGLGKNAPPGCWGPPSALGSQNFPFGRWAGALGVWHGHPLRSPSVQGDPRALQHSWSSLAKRRPCAAEGAAQGREGGRGPHDGRSAPTPATIDGPLHWAVRRSAQASGRRLMANPPARRPEDAGQSRGTPRPSQIAATTKADGHRVDERPASVRARRPFDGCPSNIDWPFHGPDYLRAGHQERSAEAKDTCVL